LKAFWDFGRGFEPAFPNYQDLPACFFYVGQIAFVAELVGQAFGLPGTNQLR